MRTITDHEPSLWLRWKIAAALDQPGGLRQCGHLTPKDKATVALWRPDWAWCGECAPTGIRITDPTEDRRCDRCRRVSKMIYPMLVDAGPALIMFGLCRDCHRREVGDDHG